LAHAPTLNRHHWTIEKTLSARERISRAQSLLKTLLGRPQDWTITPPRPWRHGFALASLGPTLVIVSSLIWWFPYTSEDSTIALGLFTGTVAIVLMSWSFVLAVRFRWLEPIFGGLDRMYAVHRWCGTLAIGAMFLHIQLEPEIDGGFDGLLAQFKETALDAAGLAEKAFYVLIAISLVRWVPFRWWRLTHKLMGIPFVVAVFHTLTIEKPFSPGSAWGVALMGISFVGMAAWIWRVVGRDGLLPGVPYQVIAATLHERTLELELAPVGRRLRHRAGRFAFVKLRVPGMREPHPFTIASGPDEEHLRFFVRNLGDWTGELREHDLVGARVIVEGPYGRFEPLPEGGDATQVVWVAGGVGITPFLSILATLPTGAAPEKRPLLIDCVADADSATAIDVLRAAAADGRITLELVESSQGRRLDADLLRELVGGDLTGAHVAVCGPKGLVSMVERTAGSLGANHVESEDFDIRSGIGPDLSRDLAPLERRFRRKYGPTPTLAATDAQAE